MDTLRAERNNLSNKKFAVCFLQKLCDTYYILCLNHVYPDSIRSSVMSDQDNLWTFQVCIFKLLSWSQRVVTYILKWELRFSHVEIGL